MDGALWFPLKRIVVLSACVIPSMCEAKISGLNAQVVLGVAIIHRNVHYYLKVLRKVSKRKVTHERTTFSDFYQSPRLLFLLIYRQVTACIILIVNKN